MEEDESACTSGKEGSACSNALLVWRFVARTVEVEINGAESTDAAGGSEPEAPIAAAADDREGLALHAKNGLGVDQSDQGAALGQDTQASAETGARLWLGAKDLDAALTGDQ
jgi:hypothetical protein